MANCITEITEDIESNLRLFALRKAASSSREFSDLKNQILVKVQASPDHDCPMHGKEGNYRPHQGTPTSSEYYGSECDYGGIPQHFSRKEMARELRLSAARHGREAKTRSTNMSSSQGTDINGTLGNRRGSSFSPGPPAPYHYSTDYLSRSHSVDPWPQYNSMPRRMSANTTSYGIKNKTVHRHGSFQEVGHGRLPPPPKTDVFKGRVEYLNEGTKVFCQSGVNCVTRILLISLELMKS